jgi:trigger factor
MPVPEVTATTTELPESRVRLDATVPPELLERAVERAAKQVGRNMRVPGFRAGKVPAQIILQRVGREYVVDEAIRADLNEWYDLAVKKTGIAPVGQPNVDLGDIPEEGKEFTFSVELAVIPTAKLGDVEHLKVGKGAAEPDEEAIGRELDTLRDRFARLETVERPIEDDDYVTIDFLGKLDGVPFEGGEAQGQMLQIGSGRFIPGFEEQLIGKKTGDEDVIKVTFPEEYGAAELAGQDATFDIVVHEIKAKQLPELDDDFALEVGGVDTLDELKADITKRLAEADEQRLEQLFRLATIDAAAIASEVDVPEAIAQEHAHQEFHRLMHRFESQGISQDIYLQSLGKTHDEVVAEAVPAARQQLRRQAVVSALLESKDFPVSDAEVEEAVQPLADREKISLKKALSRLQSGGQLDSLKRDLAEQKAVDWLVEHAEAVSVADAKKAKGAWTPSREEQAEDPGLWSV